MPKVSTVPGSPQSLGNVVLKVPPRGDAWQRRTMSGAEAPPPNTPRRRMGLVRVNRAVPDERHVHVDVVEDCGTEVVGAAGGIRSLVEHDHDPANHIARHDRRERRRKLRGAPAQSDPSTAKRRHDGGWRVTPDEVNVSVR